MFGRCDGGKIRDMENENECYKRSAATDCWSFLESSAENCNRVFISLNNNKCDYFFRLIEIDPMLDRERLKWYTFSLINRVCVCVCVRHFFAHHWRKADEQKRKKLIKYLKLLFRIQLPNNWNEWVNSEFISFRLIHFISPARKKCSKWENNFSSALLIRKADHIFWPHWTNKWITFYGNADGPSVARLNWNCIFSHMQRFQRDAMMNIIEVKTKNGTQFRWKQHDGSIQCGAYEPIAKHMVEVMKWINLL